MNGTDKSIIIIIVTLSLLLLYLKQAIWTIAQLKCLLQDSVKVNGVAYGIIGLFGECYILYLWHLFRGQGEKEV